MSQKISSFKDLLVWQKFHELTLDIYKATLALPAEEKYGLSSQMRRAAVSIPANIAEGFRKFSAKDKQRYINISQGSLEELRYYLILVNDLGYISDVNSLGNSVDEVGIFLWKYYKSLN